MKEEEKHRFRLRGKEFELSKKEAEQVLKGKNYKQNRSRYFVEVEGRYIPVKESLHEILRNRNIGLTKLDFTTQDAVRIFRKLGFEVLTKGRKGKALDDLVGVIKEGEGFDAVEDKARLYE